MSTAIKLIEKLNSSIELFTNQEDVQSFLDTLPSKEQSKLIDMIYLGRSHIHQSKIQSEYIPLSINRNEHISKNDYAQIIYQKKTSIPLYLEKLVECAKNSDINLEEL